MIATELFFIVLWSISPCNRPFALWHHICIRWYTSVLWLQFWVAEMYCSDWEKDANCIGLKWLLQQDFHIQVYVLVSKYTSFVGVVIYVAELRAIRLTPFNHSSTFLPLKMVATIRKYKAIIVYECDVTTQKGYIQLASSPGSTLSGVF